MTPELRPPRALTEASLAWDEGPEQLQLAWELARCVPEAERRALGLLAFAALVNQRAGSTRMPLGAGHLEAVLERLGVLGEVKAVRRLVDTLPEAVRPVLAELGAHAPLLIDGGWLYLQQTRHHEDRLVESLSARIAAPMQAMPEDVQRALAAVSTLPVALVEEQKAAVEAALSQPLTVVTGGPGTGKTSIGVAILRGLVRLGVKPEAIALAAPTGKAAHRLAESIQGAMAALQTPGAEDRALLAALPEARTLHRLLGYSPSRARFNHHQGNPLAEEVVIVDEASMIDLVLMDRLVRSVQPGARLVLLGDAEQLPSVDAGAVLRDLVPVEGDASDPRARIAVRLTASHRMKQGGSLLALAQQIRAGGPVDLDGLQGSEVAFWPSVPGDGQLKAFLDRWWAEELRGGVDVDRAIGTTYAFDEAERERLDALFRHFESFRLLALTRAQVQDLNAHLHQRALDAKDPGLYSSPDFLPGEPVIVERNDYELGLFNGDQGLVLRGHDAHGGPRFMAVFREGPGFRALPLERLRGRLRLAYALTVHKAQGSELEHVALVLPERDLPLLTRELLYTGLTRARASVVIVGQAAIFAAGVKRGLARFTGVGERLCAALGALPAQAREAPRRR